jgi:hypothetical protein
LCLAHVTAHACPEHLTAPAEEFVQWGVPDATPAQLVSMLEACEPLLLRVGQQGTRPAHVGLGVPLDVAAELRELIISATRKRKKAGALQAPDAGAATFVRS